MAMDAPVMSPESPRGSKVGEIDTRPPFQSVRAAVSLFRQVSFPKQQPPRLSSSSSQDTGDMLDKETQLMLAEQEMDRVKQSLDDSVKAKAQALSDLDSAQRKTADLRAKLEATKQSKKRVVLNQQLESETEETDSAREDYILVSTELFMAKQELAELKQQLNISVKQRLAELQRAEEAECTSMVNYRKVKDMSREIEDMRDAAALLKSDAMRKKEEEEKIKQESISGGETYAERKREAEERLEDLRRDCDPKLRKDIDELEEISEENECLKEEIRLARELKEVKSETKAVCDEESSYKSLVCLLTVELDRLQRENRDLKEKEKERKEVEQVESKEANREVDEIRNGAEKTKRETEETMKHADELRREAAARHMVMGEATKQLEIVKRAVEKAKTAEKRAVADMKLLTNNKESLTDDEPDKKIRISLKEYEELRGKHEESERMVEYKSKTVAVQLEEINESRVEGERMLEEKMKEMEELKVATDGALRTAEIAEEAHSIVDAELRKWKPQEL